MSRERTGEVWRVTLHVRAPGDRRPPWRLTITVEDAVGATAAVRRARHAAKQYYPKHRMRVGRVVRDRRAEAAAERAVAEGRW